MQAAEGQRAIIRALKTERDMVAAADISTLESIDAKITAAEGVLA
jgi:hypothetical protein